MKLQLAIDVLTSEEALVLAWKTRKFVDIIEIGTPLIKHEGIHLVRLMKALFPEKRLLVDLKTMDVGEYEADFCFDAGADIVTVLGAADLRTIEGAIRSARKHGGEVVVDMINVEEKIKRARQVAELGADYVGIHSGIDQQNAGQSPLKDLKKMAKKVKIPLVVAGGIDEKSLRKVVKYRPAVVVVGGAITRAKNPKKAAKRIKKAIEAAQ